MKSLFLFIFWLYQRVEGNQPRQSNCLLHLSQFKLLLWTLGTCLPIRKLHMENEDLKGLHSCTTKIRTSWNIELLTKLFEIFYSVLCLWRDLPTLNPHWWCQWWPQIPVSSQLLGQLCSVSICQSTLHGLKEWCLVHLSKNTMMIWMQGLDLVKRGKVEPRCSHPL